MEQTGETHETLRQADAPPAAPTRSVAASLRPFRDPGRGPGAPFPRRDGDRRRDPMKAVNGPTHRRGSDLGTATGRPTRTLARLISVALGAFAVCAQLVRHASRCAAPLFQWAYRQPALLAVAVGRAARGAALPVARATGRFTYSLRVAYCRARAAHVPPAPVPPQFPVEDRPRSGVAFEAATFQNQRLGPGARQIDAVVEVSARSVEDDWQPARVEIILLDCSGSMGRPWSKLRAAGEAAAAALDALPDGTLFAIVRGDHDAAVVYPPGGDLAAATADTRAAAKHVLRFLWPEGGTAIGRWLLLARELAASRPGAIAHALLVTDGRNEDESVEELRAALAASEGCLQCDCLGIGEGWESHTLRSVASTLLGTVDVVPDPAHLADHFTQLTAGVAQRRVARVTLDVWVPQHSEIRSLQQVSPHVEDLTDRAVVLDSHTRRYPLGAWASEVRHYLLRVEVPAHGAGSELLGARATVLVDGSPAAQTLVTAIWSENAGAHAEDDPVLAHYEQQTALVDHVRRGLRARQEGDDVTPPTSSASPHASPRRAATTRHRDYWPRSSTSPGGAQLDRTSRRSTSWHWTVDRRGPFACPSVDSVTCWEVFAVVDGDWSMERRRSRRRDRAEGRALPPQAWDRALADGCRHATRNRAERRSCEARAIMTTCAW